MLSNRQLLVLKAIVEEYVKTNEPVGSRAVCERPEFLNRVSSATIRNDMMRLEELNLLTKTHTSSGRVPSEEGYRTYVKMIINNDDLDYPDSYPLIDEIFNRNATSREQAIKESINLISDLTNYMGMALGKASYNARIKRLQFVPLGRSLAVVLMVTDHGYVESKKIIIPNNINQKDIDRVIGLLNDYLYNCPISEIDRVLKYKLSTDLINNNLDYYEELMSVFVRLFTEMARDKFFLAGQSNMLNHPEFQNVEKIHDLMDAIERQELVEVIKVSNNGITVRIGKENQIKAMQDCTVISVPYETENGDSGAIAIFGPTRMEYRKVIPLLEYIAKHIKNIT